MAKLKDKHKVKASSLVEVLVALVIIMAVFVIAMGIYTRVTQSGISLSKMKAQKEMSRIIQESIQNGDFEGQSIERDNIVYEKSVTAYAGFSDIILIEVKADQNGRLLGHLRRLVKHNGKEN